jgi:hypothetical protein
MHKKFALTSLTRGGSVGMVRSRIKATEFNFEALLPDPGHYEAEICVAVLKNYKLPVNDEIPSKLFLFHRLLAMALFSLNRFTVFHLASLPDSVL